ASGSIHEKRVALMIGDFSVASRSSRHPRASLADRSRQALAWAAKNAFRRSSGQSTKPSGYGFAAASFSSERDAVIEPLLDRGDWRKIALVRLDALLSPDQPLRLASA